MRALQVEDGPSGVWVVTFTQGDDPIVGLTDWARGAAVNGASFTAIGAFEEADIGWFDLDLRRYRSNPVRRQVEVLSLVGDVTDGVEPGEDPMVHAHVVLGTRDGAALGGHLLHASVRPTLEVVIRESAVTLPRRHDATTGLALIDLERVAEPAGPPSRYGGWHGQNSR